MHTSFLSDGGLGPGDTMMKKRNSAVGDCQPVQETNLQVNSWNTASSKHTDTSCKVQNEAKKVPQKLLAAVKEDFRETWRVYKSSLN